MTNYWQSARSRKLEAYQFCLEFSIEFGFLYFEFSLLNSVYSRIDLLGLICQPNCVIDEQRQHLKINLLIL